MEPTKLLQISECSVWAGPILIVDPVDTTAGLAPAQGPTAVDLIVAPTAASADAGATAAHRCPTAAGTSATA